MTEAVLKVADVSKSYGAVQALAGSILNWHPVPSIVFWGPMVRAKVRCFRS